MISQRVRGAGGVFMSRTLRGAADSLVSGLSRGVRSRAYSAAPWFTRGGSQPASSSRGESSHAVGHRAGLNIGNLVRIDALLLEDRLGRILRGAGILKGCEIDDALQPWHGGARAGRRPAPPARVDHPGPPGLAADPGPLPLRVPAGGDHRVRERAERRRAGIRVRPNRRRGARPTHRRLGRRGSRSVSAPPRSLLSASPIASRHSLPTS